jgi:hypothetical protein
VAKIVVEGSVGIEVRDFFVCMGIVFISNFYYQNSEIMSKISDFQFQNS